MGGLPVVPVPMSSNPLPDGAGERSTARRTVRRAAVVAAAVATVVGVLALVLTPEGVHRYELALPSAGQLDAGDEVRVGGRRVGRVVDLRLTADRTAIVALEVGDELAPLHEGTTATVRAPSPSGADGGHVALGPGPNDAPTLADGTRIPADPVSPAGDVDEFLGTLDAPTRRGLRRLADGVRRTARGREGAANATLEGLDPTLRAGRALLAEAVRDGPALERFLESSSRIVGALAAERQALTGLVSGARRVSRDVAAEEASVDATLVRLPATLAAGRRTLRGLATTLGDLDPLVGAARPATEGLAPLLRGLRPLVAAATPTVADARALLRSPGPHDDLVDLLGRTPGFADAAVPTLGHTASAASAAQPIARFARPYTPDLVGWLWAVSHSTAGSDANGQLARILPVVDESAVVADPVLGPVARGLRRALGPALEAGARTVGARRCPGTATQVRPDGSNDPRRSPERLDCDRGTVLPGP